MIGGIDVFSYGLYLMWVLKSEKVKVLFFFIWFNVYYDNLFRREFFGERVWKDEVMLVWYCVGWDEVRFGSGVFFVNVGSVVLCVMVCVLNYRLLIMRVIFGDVCNYVCEFVVDVSVDVREF